MCTLDKISYLLDKQNKKQKDLTTYLGLSKNAYTNWKGGFSASYKKYLPQIADFFGVSVDYLLGKNESSTASPFSLLAPEEQHLVDNYRALDEKGKDKITDYLTDLVKLHGLHLQELPDGAALTASPHELSSKTLSAIDNITNETDK